MHVKVDLFVCLFHFHTSTFLAVAMEYGMRISYGKHRMLFICRKNLVLI